MTKVLCEIENCAYLMFKPEEGPAYQYQCGNDEIEIGLNDNGHMQCFSFEPKEEE